MQLRKLLHKILSLPAIITIFGCSFLVPAVSYAFVPNLQAFACLVLATIKILGPILVAVAFLLFFWGVAKFILASGNEKELATGRQFMIWGVLGLFILVTLWGILNFLSAQFEFGTAGWHFLPTGGAPVQACGDIPVVNSTINYNL